MAWTTPKTWASGYVVLAADLNTHLRDNLNVTAPAVLTTAGDILYASGANTPARLAKSTTSTQYLANTGTSNIPAWNEVALATGVSGTLPVGNGGIGTSLSGVAKGGLLGGTGSGTFGILAVGTNDSSPRAASGETTGLDWIKNSYAETDAPDVNDDTTDGWSIGSIWADITADKVYICLDITDGAAVWTEITQSGGAAAVVVKSARLSIASSTTRATIFTPTSGTKALITAVNIKFDDSVNMLADVYFGTGAQITTNVTNEIFTWKHRSTGTSFGRSGADQSFSDGGRPTGAVDEVVSMVLNVSNGSEVAIIVHYIEE